ncbi:MAG: sigma factor [Chthoniobacter sp.]
MPPTDAPDLLALLDRYERPLVRYAQSIVGDLDSARDVVQDVFIRWVRREESAKPPAEAGQTASKTATRRRMSRQPFRPTPKPGFSRSRATARSTISANTAASFP